MATNYLICLQIVLQKRIKAMKINTILISVKIDKETKRYIDYLRKNKVNPSNVIRDAIKQPLKDKCIDFKINQTKEKLPF